MYYKAIPEHRSPAGFNIRTIVFLMLFVNDYPECLEYSEAYIYAYDTTEDVSSKYKDFIETKLRADLYNSMKWMDNNKLT